VKNTLVLCSVLFNSEVLNIEVFVNIKSVGKRKPPLIKEPYTLPDNINTLRELIEAVVRVEVSKYNEKPSGVKLLPFLTDIEIENAETVGKIGFGRVYNKNKVSPDKATETAIEGFSDGLYKVLINDCEAENLDGEITLRGGDILTFIKLTFLAGRRF
jgi:hypothetical protein